MAGRRLASPALENRTQTVRLTMYSADEMNLILEKMGVTSSITRRELVDAFQYQLRQASILHVSPAPSFRDFIRIAKQIVTEPSQAEAGSAEIKRMHHLDDQGFFNDQRHALKRAKKEDEQVVDLIGPRV